MAEDEVLIHPAGWRDVMRYATHHRGDSWQPPIITLESALMRNLMWELTPGEYALFVAIVAEYAGSTLLAPGTGARGLRRLTLDRLTRSVSAAGWSRHVRVTSALERLEAKGLVALTTDAGEMLVRRPSDGVVLEESRGEESGVEVEESRARNGQKFLDPAHTIPLPETDER